jgi:ribosome maturation factor RimP
VATGGALAGQAWRLVLPPAKVLSRTAAKKLAKAAAAGLAAAPAEAQQTLDFNLDEVREARLVPVIDFKRGRGASSPRAAKVDERS